MGTILLWLAVPEYLTVNAVYILVDSTGNAFCLNLQPINVMMPMWSFHWLKTTFYLLCQEGDIRKRFCHRPPNPRARKPERSSGNPGTWWNNPKIREKWVDSPQKNRPPPSTPPLRLFQVVLLHMRVSFLDRDFCLPPSGPRTLVKRVWYLLLMSPSWLCLALEIMLDFSSYFQQSNIQFVLFYNLIVHCSIGSQAS
jgi:hypothetical protein